MKILSLFDGISCGRLALERAGIPVEKYYASEIDKYAIQVTQKNRPDTIQVGDVNKLNYLELLDVDMVIGGSPCQDLSIAKQNREGLHGARSGLFWKYVEALEVIRPKWFLLENVASMRNEDRDAITATLKKIYPETECIMINSALVSAQQRKRYYWTNWHVKQPQDKGVLLKDILESGNCEHDKSFCITGRYLAQFGSDDYTEKRYFDMSMGQVAFEPIRVGQIGKGGQGDRIYSVRGKSVCLNANGGGRGAKTGLYKVDLPDGDYIIRKLTPVECERLQTLPDNWTEGVSNTQRYKAIGNGWTVDVIAWIFSQIPKEINNE
jgi:DNA (cytosine-5)-methyltransferase 3A